MVRSVVVVITGGGDAQPPANAAAPNSTPASKRRRPVFGAQIVLFAFIAVFLVMGLSGCVEADPIGLASCKPARVLWPFGTIAVKHRTVSP